MPQKGGKQQVVGKRDSPPVHFQRPTGGSTPRFDPDNHGRESELRIGRVASKSLGTVPTIDIFAPQLNKCANFMIDTGAETNVIKFGSLNNIGSIENLKNSRNDREHVTPLGSIILNIFGKPIEFFVVPDEFPTRSDGIIGSAFLRGGAIVFFCDIALFWKDLKFYFANETPSKNSTCDLKPRPSSHAEPNDETTLEPRPPKTQVIKSSQKKKRRR